MNEERQKPRWKCLLQAKSAPYRLYRVHATSTTIGLTAGLATRSVAGKDGEGGLG